ncbi:unnamed protein product [Alopecurus aequalis]
MAWEPEQLNLGALGFAGICRETHRVLLHAILPNKGSQRAAFLCVLLLVNIAAYRAFLSLLDAVHVSDIVLAAGLAFAYGFSNGVCVFSIIGLSPTCTACYVSRVATLYCTHGDSGASNGVIRDLPSVPLLFLQVLPLAILYIAWLELWQLHASDEVVLLALQLLRGAAFLSVAVRALLAGKFWAAAAVFVPLDGCFVALQISFPDLVMEDALGLGRGFQVAAGAAMAVALWAVVVATLVAQPVVYLVCKNNYHKVVPCSLQARPPAGRSTKYLASADLA